MFGESADVSVFLWTVICEEAALGSSRQSPIFQLAQRAERRDDILRDLMPDFTQFATCYDYMPLVSINSILWE